MDVYKLLSFLITSCIVFVNVSSSCFVFNSFRMAHKMDFFLSSSVIQLRLEQEKADQAAQMAAQRLKAELADMNARMNAAAAAERWVHSCVCWCARVDFCVDFCWCMFIYYLYLYNMFQHSNHVNLLLSEKCFFYNPYTSFFLSFFLSFLTHLQHTIVLTTLPFTRILYYVD